MVEAGKDNLSYFVGVLFTVFDGWIICDFTPCLTVFQSDQDVARPGIEPRNSDLRVRCLTRLRYEARFFTELRYGRGPGRQIMAGLLPLKVYSFAKLVTKLYCNAHVPGITVDQFAEVHVHVFVNNILTS